MSDQPAVCNGISRKSASLRLTQEVSGASGCQRPIEVIALRLFATRSEQEIDVRLGLDAFDNNLDVEQMAEMDRRPNNRSRCGNPLELGK
jgi:hypothetical protein